MTKEDFIKLDLQLNTLENRHGIDFGECKQILMILMRDALDRYYEKIVKEER